uniref:Uncharacterized protein n=1 Tax=Echinococcus granulosus TaxID=6210 RepID=A0A068X2F8_ECHGR|nr:hypothetical protein EgrG_000401700 [Echinococcus granulosus]
MLLFSPSGDWDILERDFVSHIDVIMPLIIYFSYTLLSLQLVVVH